MFQVLLSLCIVALSSGAPRRVKRQTANEVATRIVAVSKSKPELLSTAVSQADPDLLRVALTDADIPTSSRGASARERCRLKSRWAGGSSKSAKRRRSFSASLFRYPADLHFSPRSAFNSAEFSLCLSHRHQLKNDSKLILSSCFSSRSQLAPRASSVINLAPGLAFAELKNLLRTF